MPESTYTTAADSLSAHRSSRRPSSLFRSGSGMDPHEKTRSRFGKIHIDTLAATARSISSAFSRDAAAGHTHHASTPPIAVPMPATHAGWQDAGVRQVREESNVPMPESSPRYMNTDYLSPIETASRTRQPSISFDPAMRLESGGQLPLQSRLPRPEDAPSVAAKEYFDAPAQATSLPARASEYHSPSPILGGITGSLNSRSGIPQNEDGLNLSLRRTRPRRRSSAAQKFLMGMTGSVTEEAENPASLTSDSSMSPLSEGLHTPSSPANLLGAFGDPAQLSQSLVAADDPALQEAMPWPFPSYGSLGVARNKTWSAKGNPRSRSARRTLSARSPNSACSSPASAFLQNLNSGATAKQEFDSEGQEIGSYVLGREIGRGGFSTVKEAYTIDGDMEKAIAVKIVRKQVTTADSDNDAVQANFDQEVQLWRCLNHENILKLEMVVDHPDATFAFMQLNRGGSLYDLIKKNRKGVSARLAQRYSHQLACALRYLHEDMRIVHGDVKLENCLIDTTNDADDGGNLLLCDFGMARFIKSPHDEDGGLQSAPDPTRTATASFNSSENKPQNENGADVGVGGSLQYAAPEMITQASVTTASDMWAFAVVVYAMHTGSLPFNHALLPKLQDLITKGVWDVQKLRSCWGLVEAGEEESEKVVEVVEGCFRMDAERRMTVRDVLDSPWLDQFGGDSP